MAEPGATKRLPGTARSLERDRSAVDTASEIRRARLRQDVSDLSDLALLIGVNLLFLFWESAQIPFLGRDLSMMLLLGLNAFYVGSWIVARVVPLLRARRIATSWSESERARLRL